MTLVIERHLFFEWEKITKFRLESRFEDREIWIVTKTLQSYYFTEVKNLSCNQNESVIAKGKVSSSATRTSPGIHSWGWDIRGSGYIGTCWSKLSQLISDNSSNICFISCVKHHVSCQDVGWLGVSNRTPLPVHLAQKKTFDSGRNIRRNFYFRWAYRESLLMKEAIGIAQWLWTPSSLWLTGILWGRGLSHELHLSYMR